MAQMIRPSPNSQPYDSCYHVDTTPGDTFGGIGVDGLTDYCEELSRERIRHDLNLKTHHNLPTRKAPTQKSRRLDAAMRSLA